MTTIEDARRRSTDQILEDAMREAGNGDAKKVAEGGRALHCDAFESLDVHRQALRASDWTAGTVRG